MSENRTDAYAALLARLFAARRGGVVFGLDRIRDCLARMGDPQDAPAARVHIGGTNGKGSTAAFVAAMVRASGIRTGLYTSPHLCQLRERFAIDGEPASEDEIARAADEVVAAGGDALPFFEQVTAIALALFARAGVEVAILEVGLGGRLDATNAVAAEVAAVTGAALDHQDYLGETLAEIAREKAGIFKPGQRAVIGCAGLPEAVPDLVAGARAAGVASLAVIGPADVARADAAATRGLGLAGPHQRGNAACALAVVDALAALARENSRLASVARRGGLEDPAVRARGLADARIAGRMETLARSPRIIADGAHNPHAAEALARAIAELTRRPGDPDRVPDGAPDAPGADGRPVVVLAVSRDKDVAGVIRPLARIARAAVATAYGQPRSLPARELADVIRAEAPGLAVHCEPDPARAVATARALAGPGGLIVAAGSLFLVGELRHHLLGVPLDPVAVTDPMGLTAPAGPEAPS